jgi:hypothetical protein
MSSEPENGLRKRPSQSRLSIDNDRITKKPFTRTFLNPNDSHSITEGPPSTTCGPVEDVGMAEIRGDWAAGGPKEHKATNRGSGTFAVEVDEHVHEAGEHEHSLTFPMQARRRPFIEKKIRVRGNRCCECRKVDCNCGHKASSEGCYWCIGP